MKNLKASDYPVYGWDKDVLVGSSCLNHLGILSRKFPKFWKYKTWFGWDNVDLKHCCFLSWDANGRFPAKFHNYCKWSGWDLKKPVCFLSIFWVNGLGIPKGRFSEWFLNIGWGIVI